MDMSLQSEGAGSSFPPSIWWYPTLSKDMLPWRGAIKAELSYIMATTYIAIMCFLAIVMCIRMRTRLRIISLFVTFLGLAIATVGYLKARYIVHHNVFWAWNFTGEGLAVVVLTYSIVSVGTGFYPMAENRNVLRRVSLIIISTYGLLALANVIYYIQQKVFLHPLSGEDVQRLRDGIVRARLFTAQDLESQRAYEQHLGRIPLGDAALTGAVDWTRLAWVEQEYYMRPSTEYYLFHQVIMFFTCVWACMYLFIPLVRHHRHGPVGRAVDSDMMAVGVWYMSSLLSLAFAYSLINFACCIWHELIFVPQIQALDLCIRVTIGPIFFIPAPRFLIRFYRKHFQKFRGSAGTRNDTSAAGRTWGSGKKSMYGLSTSDSRNHHSISQQSTTVDSKPATSSTTAKGYAAAGSSGDEGRGGSGQSRGMLDVYDQEKYLEAGCASSNLSGQDGISEADSRRILSKDCRRESMPSRVLSGDGDNGEDGEDGDVDSIDIRLGMAQRNHSHHP
ncbi:hypothetical protein BGZ89_006024 [Linnemannia elongata]|nr:hypothetical protein BGZ89_006024 [Linnemannia elongata]